MSETAYTYLLITGHLNLGVSSQAWIFRHANTITTKINGKVKEKITETKIATEKSPQKGKEKLLQHSNWTNE